MERACRRATVPAPRVPLGADRDRLRQRKERLAAADRAPAPLRQPGRRDAALRQEPLLRRVRLLLGPGRPPPAPPPPLLPETPPRGARSPGARRAYPPR